MTCIVYTRKRDGYETYTRRGPTPGVRRRHPSVIAIAIACRTSYSSTLGPAASRADATERKNKTIQTAKRNAAHPALRRMKMLHSCT